LEGFHCRYVSDWVVIKDRWDLAVDPDERAAIEDVLADCPAEEIGAVVAVDGRDEDPATREPAATQPRRQTSEGDCDPSYPGVCVAAPPPDLDCGDIQERRFAVHGSDSHRLDGDDDGIGCES
jgi:hypothetical protein